MVKRFDPVRPVDKMTLAEVVAYAEVLTGEDQYIPSYPPIKQLMTRLLAEVKQGYYCKTCGEILREYDDATSTTDNTTMATMDTTEPPTPIGWVPLGGGKRPGH